MQFQPRLLLALGALLLPFAASAQDVELVTEAPVTIDLTFSTMVTTTNGQTGAARVDTTRAYTSVMNTAAVLESLRSDGIIPTPQTTGWRLVAVRPAPALFTDIDSSFDLYAIQVVNNAVVARVPVPLSKFGISPARDYVFDSPHSVANAVFTHSTRNPISGSGLVTNAASAFLTPSFVRREVPARVTGPFSEPGPGGAGVRTYNLIEQTTSAYTIANLDTAGFTSIAFETRTIEPVFFYAMRSMLYTARGDFSGSLINTTTVTKRYTARGVAEQIVSGPTASAPVPGSGLVTVRINVGAASLVERSLYPAVSF